MEAKEEGEMVVKPLMQRERGSSSPSSLWMVVASTAVAVFGSFEFGISVGYSSPSQSGIMHDLNLSLPQYSLFGSILTIGAMIGAILSGRIADLIGRRCAMAVSDILCIIGWVSIFLTKNIMWLELGRLSVGCGIGLLSYVVPVYIAEITPKNLRGGFAAVNQLMICCGGSLAYLLGTIVTWRILAIIGTFPCFLQLLGLIFIPESPRWLVSHLDLGHDFEVLSVNNNLQAMVGKDHEFEAVLKRLRGEHSDVSQEAEEIMEFTVSLQKLPQSGMLDLFQKKYLHAVIVGVGLMVLQQFGGVNAICFYASEIFVSAGFSSGDTGMIAMAAVQIPMTTLGVLLLDRSGRRPLLMARNYISNLNPSISACPFFSLKKGFTQFLNNFLIPGFCSRNMHRLFPCRCVIHVEGQQGHEFSKELNTVLALAGILIFPLNMKGTAGSLVTLVSWVGSWIISYTFNFLMMWSSAGTFFIFASICGLTVLFVERLVPETKGRTLEEIQASMSLILQ
ncbi:Sugar transporter [Musa troglodytarum]|uniref:Sugar transporter n=1 Tax=Musa troglodytarum TaxID=320322 RepID=A0A9E7KLT4_9LILI|nr:Sugar transporter [Musa troglodytarum]